MRYVGGCVRKIIKKQIVDDIDLATNLKPNEVCDALKKIEINMTLVIRLAGTNVDKGNKILKKSKINYIEASTLEDAANKAVNALKELENN